MQDFGEMLSVVGYASEQKYPIPILLLFCYMFITGFVVSGIDLVIIVGNGLVLVLMQLIYQSF